MTEQHDTEQAPTAPAESGTTELPPAQAATPPTRADTPRQSTGLVGTHSSGGVDRWSADIPWHNLFRLA
jgi:hypothetical protein